MESLLITLGFLAIVYGAFLSINALPADPLIKGISLIVTGVLLILYAYLRIKRMERGTKTGGAGYA